MKAISLKAQGDSLTIAKGAISAVAQFAVKNSLKIAGIASAVSYLGCMSDSNVLLFSGAVAAMLALRMEYSKKGGEQ